MFSSFIEISSKRIASFFVPRSSLFMLVMTIGGISFLALSCGAKPNTETGLQAPGASEGTTVTGRIQNVKSSSFLGIGSMTVIDEQGVEWEFEGRDLAIPDFSPSHLRDHMLGGLAVTVEYRRDGESLILVGILDAPAQ